MFDPRDRVKIRTLAVRPAPPDRWSFRKQMAHYTGHQSMLQHTLLRLSLGFAIGTCLAYLALLIGVFG